MENFEEQLRKDLHQFLLSMKEVDERMPWSSHATEANGLSHDENELMTLTYIFPVYE